MIEIAYWGQNQVSFNKASKMLERMYNIKISTTTVRKVTEYVGKEVYKYVMNNSENIWNTRANININCIDKKRNIIYRIRWSNSKY